MKRTIRPILALSAALMIAAIFIACTNDDNPSNHKPFSEDDATLVINDAELRSAITKSTPVKLANDIKLSNSTLNIAEGTTVTLDLGGHTLDRGRTSREWNTGGQVITVRKGATLNLSNGTLTGGWGGNGGGLANEGGTANLKDVNITGCIGDDRGGGISNQGTLTMTGGSISGNTSKDGTDPKGGGGLFNYKDATATLKGVSITGNKADIYGGGGICNFGVMTIDGCTITGNTAGSEGGGIWQEGTLNIQGTVKVTDNKAKDAISSNVYLYEGALVNVTGSLEGSKIGISMKDMTGTFTSGYNTKNSGVNPATIFSADLPEVQAVSPDDNSEAQLTNALPEGSVYYIERAWDDANKVVTVQVRILSSDEYTTLEGGDDIELAPGYYVVKGNIEHDDIIMTGNGVHHLIICDGAKVEADILKVCESETLIIYGQNLNTGTVYVPNGADDMYEQEAAIGGDESHSAGTIIFHGATIETQGHGGAAGIGGGFRGNGGTVTIYGGVIHTTGGTNTETESGAGIGGGFEGNGGTVTIYGGQIFAQGNFYGGAGIGSGDNRSSNILSMAERNTETLKNSPHDGGTVTIYGGYIEATGGTSSAGIGGGSDGGGANVTIHGGVVKAWGNGNGAGIGTGVKLEDGISYLGELTVTGGEVYAYGSASGSPDGPGGGAGIGGGRDANGSKVTISGGYVYAKGGNFAAGIGSGCESLFNGGVQAGSLTVTGGRVEAYGGEDAAGIGGGEDADGGTVTISGGYVYAKGSYGGAGIGGGEEGDGANVTITGGTVHASAGSGGTGNRAIGPGYGSDAYGSLTIGDLMMVYSERMAAAVERHDMCWYRTDVHVELCTHPGYTADTCPYHKH